jgi:hypothetical protein
MFSRRKKLTLNVAEIAKKNGYVEIDGALFHPSHPKVKALLVATPTTPQGGPTQLGKIPAPLERPTQKKTGQKNPKKTNQKKPESNPIPYEMAEAILVIPGSVKSTNELKWKHWIYHYRDKKNIDKRIEETAYWKIPYHGALPKSPATKPRKLLFVRVGGRMMDRINFANGCKPILDFLVSRKWLVEDSEAWVDDQYMQVPGKEPRIEILFLKPPSKESKNINT